MREDLVNRKTWTCSSVEEKIIKFISRRRDQQSHKSKNRWICLSVTDMMITFNSREEICPQSYNRRPNNFVHRRADYTFISHKAYEHVHRVPSPDCSCLMPRCMSSLSSLAVAVGWQPSLAHVFLLLHAHGRHCLRHLWSRDSMSSTGVTKHRGRTQVE